MYYIAGGSQCECERSSRLYIQQAARSIVSTEQSNTDKRRLYHWEPCLSNYNSV